MGAKLFPAQTSFRLYYKMYWWLPSIEVHDSATCRQTVVHSSLQIRIHMHTGFYLLHVCRKQIFQTSFYHQMEESFLIHHTPVQKQAAKSSLRCHKINCL